MGILDDNTKNKTQETLSKMEGQVTIIFFKSKNNCDYCDQTEQLVDEIASMNQKINLEKYDLDTDKQKADEYNVERAPAIVMFGTEKRKVRFFGIPSGYEFSTFISDILDVARGYPKISPELIEKIKKIDFPVHMQVFVTPNCPYCPGAVKVAHDFALINPNITGDMVEASEFQDLAEKYEVMGVPKTIVNEKLELTGAYPTDIVLKKILELKQ